MAFKVVLSPRAQRDLEDIRDYIAGNDPDTAYSFCSNLAKHAYSLRTFPKRGHEVRNRLEIWKIPFHRYLIFYKIDEETSTVEILRFWHAAQDRRRLRLREAGTVYVTSVAG